MLLKELQSLALDVKVLTENNEELIIREFEDETEPDTRRDEPVAEQDFNFDIDEDDEDDEIGSIFDEAGEDDDFISDDLFGEEDDDAMDDIDEDGSLGDLFGDEDEE